MASDTPTPERGESDHITEALNDLEHAVKGEYGFPSVHPEMQRKYDRDMAIVTDARKAYAALIAEVARKDAEIAALDAWFKAHPDQYGEDGWIMYDSAQRLIIARQYGFDDISAQSVAELIPLLNPGAPRDATD